MLGSYMDQVKSVSVPTRDQEAELLRKYRDGDKKAGDQLITANLRFVVKVANTFKGYGFDLSDLVQEGTLGLMRALEKHQGEQGRFLSYAVWWIKAYMYAYVLKNWSIVKMTARQQHNFFKLRRIESIEKLAEELGLSEEAVAGDRAMAASKTSSLDVTLPDDDSTTALDMLKDDKPVPEQVCTEADTSSKLQSWRQAIMMGLDDRERFVITKRLLADEPITFDEISQELGCSGERARQLEVRAIAKMRRAAFIRMAPGAVGDPRCAGYLEPLKNMVLSCSSSEAV